MKAFVLINAASGSEKKVRKAIKNIPGVSNVDIVFGEYDIIVEIEVPEDPGKTRKEITDVVIQKIRQIEGVQATMTLPVVR